MTPNTKYQANVVIDRALAASNSVVWMADDVAASFNSRAALNAFIKGCSASGMSVYDVVAQKFLCGTVDQLCQ